MVELTEVEIAAEAVLTHPVTDDPLLEALQEDDGDSEYEDDEEDDGLSENDIAERFGLDDDEDEEDDDEEEEESLLERLSALVDVVPPTTRRSISRTVKNAASAAWGTAQWVGSAAWVVATAAMLVGLPVALELEREQFVFQQEAQMRAQQQQAQQVNATLSIA